MPILHWCRSGLARVSALPVTPLPTAWSGHSAASCRGSLVLEFLDEATSRPPVSDPGHAALHPAKVPARFPRGWCHQGVATAPAVAPPPRNPRDIDQVVSCPVHRQYCMPVQYAEQVANLRRIRFALRLRSRELRARGGRAGAFPPGRHRPHCLRRVPLRLLRSPAQRDRCALVGADRRRRSSRQSSRPPRAPTRARNGGADRAEPSLGGDRRAARRSTARQDQVVQRVEPHFLALVVRGRHVDGCLVVGHAFQNNAHR
jgi:hypothetical protein